MCLATTDTSALVTYASKTLQLRSRRSTSVCGDTKKGLCQWGE